MDISDRFDIPIIVELLAKVSNVASELNVPFFIVGATARNLVLQYGPFSPIIAVQLQCSYTVFDPEL